MLIGHGHHGHRQSAVQILIQSLFVMKRAYCDGRSRLWISSYGGYYSFVLLELHEDGLRGDVRMLDFERARDVRPLVGGRASALLVLHRLHSLASLNGAR